VKTTILSTGLLPVVGSGSNGPPALADVDGDGTLEVATFSIIGPGYVFKADGHSFFGLHPDGQDVTLSEDRFGLGTNGIDRPSFPVLGAPVFAELTGPGEGFYLLAPGGGIGRAIDNLIASKQLPAENHLLIWPITDAEGNPSNRNMQAGFPRVVTDLQFFAAPAVADIDADGIADAVEGSGVYDIHAFQMNGEEVAGWPKFTNGWMVGTAAVGDIDADGQLEVIAITREGWLFAWNTTGDECGNIPWRRYHHDEWGTGNYHTDARPPASLTAADVTGIEAESSRRARIDLARVPGDDLFCGSADFDIRFSTDPIADETAFAAATPIALAAPAPGSRDSGSLVVADDAFVGATIYFGMIAADDQGNRSAFLPLGSTTFPLVDPTETPMPTATSIPTSTSTSTPLPTSTPTQVPTLTSTSVASATPTQTPDPPPTASATPSWTPTRTQSPTTTPVRVGLSGDGCNVRPGSSGSCAWLGLSLALSILRRRRRREGVSR
jgi:hypothetical protein